MKTNQQRRPIAEPASIDGARESGKALSKAEFAAVLKHERRRADRSGGKFSVVTFDLQAARRISRDPLVSRVAAMSRSIDCVGETMPGVISILLPDTEAPGAVIFGSKVSSDLSRNLESSPAFEVYTYPEDWQASFSGDEKGGATSGKGRGGAKDLIESLFVERIPGWKRGLDYTGAITLLALASPVFIALYAYVRLVSPGPAFFKQIRIGYKGRPFEFWKFRTMVLGNSQSVHGNHAQSFIHDGDIPMEKLDERDSRIIPGGRLIRKCCLDELPQLWNVLRGEMSLVGPRPCIPYEAKEYLRWHTHRFDILPGLSGLWQVSGKNKLSFKQMVRLDIAYCRSICLWKDVLILLRTPLAIGGMVLESVLKRLPDGDKRPLTVSFYETKQKTAH